MINKVTLLGNIGQAPDFRTLDSGQNACRLSLATNENYKDKDGNWQQRTEWHNLMCWGQLAERAAKLSKGWLVYAEGRISSRKYTDKDGIERMSYDIQVDTLRSLEKREQQQSTSAEPAW